MKQSTLKRYFKFGINHLFGSMLGGLGSVLMYHRIENGKKQNIKYRDPELFSPTRGLFVALDQFEEQIKLISTNFIPIPLDMIEQRALEKKQKSKFIALTFDDGYLDNFDLAVPVLEKYGVYATIFVTTGFISGAAKPWWFALEELIQESSTIDLIWKQESYSYSLDSIDKRYLCWDQLWQLFKESSLTDRKELSKRLRLDKFESGLDKIFPSMERLKQYKRHPLISLQPHTVSHPVLSQESNHSARAEIIASKQALESILYGNSSSFAYPYGDSNSVSPRDFELVKELGFKRAFTTESQNIKRNSFEKPFSLPRINIDYFDSISSFEQKLSGVESFVRQLTKT